VSANRPTRREFCSALVLAATASPLTDTLAAQAADVYCYLAQSGRPGRDLTIGAVTLRNILDKGRDLHGIRSQTNYLRSVRSKSTDRYKISFCKILFDYVVTQPDIAFVGTDISFLSWPDNAEERETLYLGMYRRLLASLRLPKGARVALYTKDHGIVPIKRFNREIEKLDPWLPIVTDRPSNTHKEFRDAAGFFAGLVRSGETTRNRAKIEIASHICSKLQIKRIDEATLTNHPKFRVQEIVV
jgi:hypothetical protein